MTDSAKTDLAVAKAAQALQSAEALLIGAGAGMGVDSGLPDFRGDEGFWKAYPPFRGRRFAEMSNPVWFRSDPEQAWGFFGHRLHLYRDAPPHVGFTTLLRWGQTMPGDCFVFTSNVDGQFQKAGFSEEQIVECHGSIHHLQCAQPCSHDIWRADHVEVPVNTATIRAAPPLPMCQSCAEVARPNILMFGDFHWISDRCNEQERRFRQWLQEIAGKRLVVLEFGAGKAVPTVRYECEQQSERRGLLIRVNPRDADAPPGAVSLPLGALEAIKRIDAAWESNASI